MLLTNADAASKFRYGNAELIDAICYLVPDMDSFEFLSFVSLDSKGHVGLRAPL